VHAMLGGAAFLCMMASLLATPFLVIAERGPLRLARVDNFILTIPTRAHQTNVRNLEK